MTTDDTISDAALARVEASISDLCAHGLRYCRSCEVAHPRERIETLHRELLTLRATLTELETAAKLVIDAWTDREGLPEAIESLECTLAR